MAQSRGYYDAISVYESITSILMQFGKAIIEFMRNPSHQSKQCRPHRQYKTSYRRIFRGQALAERLNDCILRFYGNNAAGINKTTVAIIYNRS